METPVAEEGCPAIRSSQLLCGMVIQNTIEDSRGNRLLPDAETVSQDMSQVLEGTHGSIALVREHDPFGRELLSAIQVSYLCHVCRSAVFATMQGIANDEQTGQLAIGRPRVCIEGDFEGLIDSTKL